MVKNQLFCLEKYSCAIFMAAMCHVLRTTVLDLYLTYVALAKLPYVK